MLDCGFCNSIDQCTQPPRRFRLNNRPISGRRTTKNIWCNGPLIASKKQISQTERALPGNSAFPVLQAGRGKKVVIKSAAILATFSLVRGVGENSVRRPQRRAPACPPSFAAPRATCQKVAELHLGSTRMSGDDLPTVVKLLKVHRGIADNLGVRTREFDAPPRQGKSQVRLEEFNLDAAWIDEPHGATIRVTVHVRIVKLLPTVKLLRIDHNQEIRGFPIDVQMSVNVVGVPSIEHFKQ